MTAALAGYPVGHPSVLPILHSGLPRLFNIPLGEFYSDAQRMADVILRGWHTFGYDGVQLSSGVTGEAEALGASTRQPADAAPILEDFILSQVLNDDSSLDTALATLRQCDVTQGGRMPLYFEAVQGCVEGVQGEGFVVAMLRGSLLAASQLCGVETLLMGLLDNPERINSVLDFTTKTALTLGTWLLDSGAHALILGEATCSPNFISPRMYRKFVKPYHTRLISMLHQAGWQHLGLHVCGNITPILDDLIDTGVDILDVDYQVAADKAITNAQGRVSLRGNIDPSGILRFGTIEDVRHAVTEMRTLTQDHPQWIIGSGCDIPPDTPAENLHAFVKASR